MAAQGTAEGEKLLRQELRPQGPGEPTIEFPRTRECPAGPVSWRPGPSLPAGGDCFGLMRLWHMRTLTHVVKNVLTF